MNLCYIVVLDITGSGGHRLMAKMLVMSLIRSHFEGSILIFRSGETPIFHLPRPDVLEINIPSKNSPTEHSFAQEAWTWKYRVAGAVEKYAKERGAQNILFLDCDMLCLRNPDHLLEGDWEIATVREPGRSFRERFFGAYLTASELSQLDGRTPVNSGTFAVRREYYLETMNTWSAIHKIPTLGGNIKPCDQCAWNRLILDTGRKVSSFEPGSVMFPLNRDFDYRIYRDATFVHCLGDTLEGKVRFLYGLYMSTYFLDGQGTLLHLLDM